jgi:VWFA-related protein
MMKQTHWLAVLGMCSALLARGQAPASFKAEAKLVVVDAVVTDKKGASVHGLAAKDFHVFEDGKEQPVAGFSTTTGPATPGMSRQRYYVLFFDDISLGMDDQMWVRRAALKFIADNAGPNRLMAVMENEGPIAHLRVAQGFTADVSRLQEVVRRPRPAPPWVPGAAAVGEPDAPYRAEFTVEDSAGGRALREAEFRLE